MFDELKHNIASRDVEANMAILMEEVDNAPEDAVLEELAIPAEEEEKILELLNKIPDDDFTSDEKITDVELDKATQATPDPTIDELLEEM